jgi:hypothetical protein
MLKTISAALLAASVIAAPAFATEAGKTTTAAPVIKADQSKTKVSSTAGVKADKANAKVNAKSDAKSDTKTKAMNANAAIAPDDHKAVRMHRHHHKHLSANKSLKPQPSLGKQTAPVSSDKRS